HVHARLDSSLLGSSQQAGRLGAIFGVWFIEGIQEQEITEMENGSPGFRKIQILPFPKSVRSTVVEESAPAVLLLRHYIRVGSISRFGLTQEFRVDFVLPAIIQNGAP